MPTAGLPHDVILNILSRQSVKCLLRFRCVSKSFCSLIDSQEFIKIHLQRSIETDSNLSLILSGTPAPVVACSLYWNGKIFCARLDSLDIAVEIDHPFKNCRGDTPIIDSCNGLIALKNHDFNGLRSLKYHNNEIALCNPSTKKHIILPKFWTDFKNCVCFVDGFGYESDSDDYKVVRIMQFGKESMERTEVFVYSLKTNSSRRFRVDFSYDFLHAFDGAFADGHVHWLVAKTSKPQIEYVILAFAVKSEEFHEVPLPPLENRDYADIMYLGSFRGCLYFNWVYGDVWVMKESWSKTFSFPEEIGDYVKPLAYSKSGEKVFVDGYDFDDDENEDNNKWKLYWYDLQNQTACQAMIHGVPQGCRHTIISVDSLVSLCLQKDVPIGRPEYNEGRMS